MATRYDTELLASLPGARDYWAVLAQTPAVAMGRVDVGGSGALTQQPYTAYGLASAGGVNRAEVEGIMVNEGAGGGGSDMYYTDYGAFAEIAVNAVGQRRRDAEPRRPQPAHRKSGGNAVPRQRLLRLSERVDGGDQHRRRTDCGRRHRAAMSSIARDTNRLEMFRDFNADLGGFIKKDRLWWYAAYRRTETDQRYPRCSTTSRTRGCRSAPARSTCNVTQNHKLIGFYQYQTKEQPDYLGAIRIGGGRQTPALMTQDTVWYSTFPLHVWKAEYNGVLSAVAVLRGAGWRLPLGVGP